MPAQFAASGARYVSAPSKAWGATAGALTGLRVQDPTLCAQMVPDPGAPVCTAGLLEEELRRADAEDPSRAPGSWHDDTQAHGAAADEAKRSMPVTLQVSHLLLMLCHPAHGASDRTLRQACTHWWALAGPAQAWE